MLKNLKKGYTFYLKKSLWKVVEVYNIKWDDGTRSIEYKLKSKSGQISFLEIEINSLDKEIYSLWKKEYEINFNKSTNPDEYIAIDELKFDKKINVNGQKYIFDERNDGVAHYAYTSEKIISLDYLNYNGTKFFSIEIWEDEYEFSEGISIRPTSISQIEAPKNIFENSLALSWVKRYAVNIIFLLFVLFFIVLKECLNKNSWSGGSDNQRDSINRSSNTIRSRNYGGYGK